MESSHPARDPVAISSYFVSEQFFYTHECKMNEIAYFKVDFNLIAGRDWVYLGLVLKKYEYQLIG